VTRPLMQNGIAELERMFESSQSDPQILDALESELRFRSVPRAATLLNRVRKAMNGHPDAPAASQELLFGHDVSVPIQEAQFPTALPVQNTRESRKRETEPALIVSVDDACKILKVTANASWDSVEHSRRAIVELARPDRLEKFAEAKRKALQQDALEANAALKALFEARRAR